MPAQLAMKPTINPVTIFRVLTANQAQIKNQMMRTTTVPWVLFIFCFNVMLSGPAGVH